VYAIALTARGSARINTWTQKPPGLSPGREKYTVSLLDKTFACARNLIAAVATGLLAACGARYRCWLN